MMEEFDFGPEEKRNRALAEIVGNPRFQSMKSYGTSYIKKSAFNPKKYKISIRVFQGPEVEWHDFLIVDFDIAAFLLKKKVAVLHWSLTKDEEELKKFESWVE